MNRRGFLRSLAIGVACLQLRLRPESVINVKDGILTFRMLEAYIERILRVNVQQHLEVYCMSAKSYKILSNYYKEPKNDKRGV